jgi:hypothetical protein
LASIDGSAVKAPLPVVEKPIPAPVTPFSGEKTLRDSIPPVKLTERGPTEKNRDLLKAALMNAVGDSQKKETPVAAPQPVVIVENIISVPQSTAAPEPVVAAPDPVPVAPTPAPTTAVAIQPEEIPYQELRKILE